MAVMEVRRHPDFRLISDPGQFHNYHFSGIGSSGNLQGFAGLESVCPGADGLERGSEREAVDRSLDCGRGG